MSKQNQPDKAKLGALIDEGYELIPLNQAHAVGKDGKKVGKRPLRRFWTQGEVPNLEETMELMEVEGHNVGVRLRRCDLVVDIDPKNFVLEGETDSDGKVLPHRPDLALEKAFGFKLKDYPLVRTGSHFPQKDPETGLHVYMRVTLPDNWEDGDKLAVGLKAFPGIDFQGLGRQVVAPGSVHPDFNRYYEWDEYDHPALADIIEAPAALIQALHKKAPGSSVHEDGEADMTPDMLQDLLDQLPVEEFREQDDWLQMMMSCHAATLGDGISEFVAWSIGDPLYAHHGANIAMRWDSLEAEVQGGVKFGTLKHIAKEHGVEQMPAPDMTNEFAGTEDDYDPATGEVLVDVPSPKRSGLRKLNDKYWTAMEGGKFMVYTDIHSAGFKRTIVEKMIWNDFKNAVANMPKVEPKSGKGQPKPVAEVWREWPGRNHYDSVEFLPEYGDEKVVELNGQKIYNTWRGFGCLPVEGDCSLLIELIHTVLAEDGKEEYAEYILNWLAYAVQFPERPAEVSVVLQGGKGTGKSTLGRVFNQLFGDHGMHITSSTLLTGRFNGHLQDVVGLFADEAFFAGDKPGIQRLKGLITEDRLSFESKGLNPVMARNTLHILMATNEPWAAPVGTQQERRFAVFESTNVRQQDEEFFGRLHDQLDDGGREAFLYLLLNRDVKTWHPRKAIPKTRALQNQADQGREAIEEFVFTALNEADPGLWSPCSDNWDNGGEVEVLIPVFEEEFRRYAKTMGKTYPSTIGSQGIGRELNGIFGDVPRKRLTSVPENFEHIQAKRPYVYVFPSLEECRQIWEKRQGFKQSWTVSLSDTIEEMAS